MSKDSYQKGRADAAKGNKKNLPGNVFTGIDERERDKYKEGFADKKREIKEKKK